MIHQQLISKIFKQFVQFSWIKYCIQNSIQIVHVSGHACWRIMLKRWLLMIWIIVSIKLVAENLEFDCQINNYFVSIYFFWCCCCCCCKTYTGVCWKYFSGWIILKFGIVTWIVYYNMDLVSWRMMHAILHVRLLIG